MTTERSSQHWLLQRSCTFEVDKERQRLGSHFQSALPKSSSGKSLRSDTPTNENLDFYSRLFCVHSRFKINQSAPKSGDIGYAKAVAGLVSVQVRRKNRSPATPATAEPELPLRLSPRQLQPNSLSRNPQRARR